MTQAGYVYILTNDSFREDWVKIGKSSRPVDVRSKELNNTAVPLPFKIYATKRTAKYNEVEKLVTRRSTASRIFAFARIASSSTLRRMWLWIFSRTSHLRSMTRLSRVTATTRRSRLGKSISKKTKQQFLCLVVLRFVSA